MKQLGDKQTALFSLSADELARLAQAVALNLLHTPLEIHHERGVGTIVRFRSPGEAERAHGHIA